MDLPKLQQQLEIGRGPPEMAGDWHLCQQWYPCHPGSSETINDMLGMKSARLADVETTCCKQRDIALLALHLIIKTQTHEQEIRFPGN